MAGYAYISETPGGNITIFMPSKLYVISMASTIWKEGNVLFNDALSTCYLQLYGARHMVKHHSDSERGNLLPPTWAARVLLYALLHRHNIT